MHLVCLGRSLHELLDLIGTLRARGLGLRALEKSIDTATSPAS